jgi:hypothetical protein
VIQDLNSARMHLIAILLAAGLSVAAAWPAAAALRVSDDGSGQILLYPYYGVDAGNSTLISISNPTTHTKALAVRVREGRNGRGVMAFNLYLAPRDAWSGVIDAAGPAGPARIATQDASCTVPAFRPGIPEPFRSFAYTGAFADHPPRAAADLGTAERTRSGYIEIIEMGELTAGQAPAQFADEVAPTASGSPANCAAVVAAWLLPKGVWATDPGREIGLPTGGLRGSAAIIDVAEGTMYTYTPTAITGFYTDTANPGGLHAVPGADRPQLSDARTSAALVEVAIADSGGTLRVERFELNSFAPIYSDPVSLALMKSQLLGEYAVDPALGASTEWVLTFPTKRDHVNSALPRAPFTTLFEPEGRAPEKLLATAFDRSGRWYGDRLGGCAAVQGCSQQDLPNSVNVLSITPEPMATVTPILGAVVGRTARNLVIPPEFADGSGSAASNRFGHLTLAFGDRAVTNPLDPTRSANVMEIDGRRYFGLPVIAASFVRYINRAAQPGVIANYGGDESVGSRLYVVP